MIREILCCFSNKSYDTTVLQPLAIDYYRCLKLNFETIIDFIKQQYYHALTAGSTCLTIRMKINSNRNQNINQLTGVTKLRTIVLKK